MTEILDQVMALAASYDIPIEREAGPVTRDKQKTYINLIYREQIQWLPSYSGQCHLPLPRKAGTCGLRPASTRCADNQPVGSCRRAAPLSPQSRCTAPPACGISYPPPL